MRAIGPAIIFSLLAAAICRTAAQQPAPDPNLFVPVQEVGNQVVLGVGIAM